MAYKPQDVLATNIRAPFMKRLVVSAVLFNLLLIALTGMSMYRERILHEEEAANTTKNICQIMNQSIFGIIRGADLGLRAARDEYEKQLSEGGIDQEKLTVFFARQQGYLPGLDSLRVADAGGTIRFGAGVNVADKIRIADRDYFIRLRNDPNAGLVISKPLLSRISKKWTIILARRLNQPDGSFAGIVYAGILVESFSELFSKVSLGKGSVISLRNEQLELFARYPDLGSPEKTLGKRQPSKQLDQLIAAGKPEATYYTPTGTDNIARLVTYRKIDNFPLYIIVGISRQEYLQGWWHDVVKTLLLLTFSVIATIVSLRMVCRSRKREFNHFADLKKQEEKFRIVADNTYDWEFWLDPEGHFIYCSPSCRLWTGYDAAEFYADPALATRIVHPDDKLLFDEHLHELDSISSQIHSVTFRILHPDGSVRWIEHCCCPVIDESGSYLGVRGSNRDVTERMKAEEELIRYREHLEELVMDRTNELGKALVAANAANLAKSTFLTTMSHELLTPMNAILGFGHLLLRDTSLSSVGCDKARSIIKSGGHLLAIIKDTLEMSRIETGQVELQEQPLDPVVLLEELTAMFCSRAKEKGLIFTCDSSPELPRCIVADPDKLRQALIKLLENAVKFTSHGSVMLRVFMSGIDRIVIEVEDTGVGIPVENVPGIFRPFEQAGRCLASHTDGVGLGLAISREHARLMGGDITVESTVGKGSCFRFEFRAQISAEAPPSAVVHESMEDGNIVISETRSVVNKQSIETPSLQNMSREWCEEFQLALTRKNITRIRKLGEEAQATDPVLSAWMLERAGQYDLDGLKGVIGLV